MLSQFPDNVNHESLTINCQFERERCVSIGDIHLTVDKNNKHDPEHFREHTRRREDSQSAASSPEIATLSNATDNGRAFSKSDYLG